MKRLFPVLTALFFLTISSVSSAQVIILESVPGDGCSMAFSRPCPPAPAPVYAQPRVIRPRYAPPPVVAAPATLPPPPVGLPTTIRPEWYPRWGMNFIYAISGDNDGTLIGGGINLEYMFNRHLGIEGSILGFGGADDGYYDAYYRSGARFGASLLWYPTGLKNNQSNFYLRAGVVGQTMSYYDDYYGVEYTAQDTSFHEFAVGWRYLFTLIPDFYAMSLGIELSTLIDTGRSEETSPRMGGYSYEDQSTAAIRMTFGFHF